MDISPETLEPRLVAVIHVEAGMDEMSAIITSSYATILEALSASDQAPAGPPMVSYDGPMIPGQPMVFSPAIPVGDDAQPVGEVRIEEVPGGPALVGLHHGPYSELGAAHQAMMAEIVRAQLQVAGPPREIYLNDPTGVAEAELLTRLEYPTAPAAH